MAKTIYIGLIGKAGAGKSHTANIIKQRYHINSEIFSFGAKLKELFSNSINIYKDGTYIYTSSSDRDLFEMFRTECERELIALTDSIFRDTVKVSVLKDLISQYHTRSTPRDDRILIARRLYQFFGTDMCRAVSPNIWIDIVDQKISETSMSPSYYGRNFIAIIDDVRFINEAYYVKSKNGYLFKILGMATTMDHESETEQDKIPNQIIYDAYGNTYDTSFDKKIISVVEKIAKQEFGKN